jgi:hypothetical protein
MQSSVPTYSRELINSHVSRCAKDFGPRSSLRSDEERDLRFGERRHRVRCLVVVGGEVTTTLEAPRIAVAETMGDFDVDQRFAFTALLVYSDASLVGDDASNVEC